MADKKKDKEPDLHEQRVADAEQARQDAHDAVDERHDRAVAMASVPQKVTDANEAAALLTITGQKPERDLSDAPPPGQLGPHMESVNPVDDPADVNTSVAGPEGDQAKPAESKSDKAK